MLLNSIEIQVDQNAPQNSFLTKSRSLDSICSCYLVGNATSEHLAKLRGCFDRDESMIPQPITVNVPQDAIVQKVTIGFLSVWNAAEKVHSERTHRERDVNQRVARRNKDNDTGYDIEIYRVRE